MLIVIDKVMACGMCTLVFMSVSCSWIQNSVDRKKAIHCSYDVPIVNRDSSIDILNTHFDVFYSGNLVLFRYPVIKLDHKDHPSVNTYLVYNRDSAYGKRLSDDSNSPFIAPRINVDSALKLIEFDNTKLETALADLKPDSTSTLTNGDLMKMYKIPTSARYPEKFKVYLYYTKELANIPYSFAKTLDSVKDKKLYLIRNVAEGFYYEKEKMTLPAREYVLKMTRIDVSKERKVDSLFKEYLRKS